MFTFAGSFELSHTELGSLMVLHGGTVQTELTDKVTHVVATARGPHPPPSTLPWGPAAAEGSGISLVRSPSDPGRGWLLPGVPWVCGWGSHRRLGVHECGPKTPGAPWLAAARAVRPAGRGWGEEGESPTPTLLDHPFGPLGRPPVLPLVAGLNSKKAQDARAMGIPVVEETFVYEQLGDEPRPR